MLYEIASTCSYISDINNLRWITIRNNNWTFFLYIYIWYWVIYIIIALNWLFDLVISFNVVLIEGGVSSYDWQVLTKLNNAMRVSSMRFGFGYLFIERIKNILYLDWLLLSLVDDSKFLVIWYCCSKNKRECYK